MKNLIFGCMSFIVVITACSCSSDDSDPTGPTDPTLEIQIDKLKAAIAPYTNIDAAIAAGYDVVFDYVSQVGNHYLNTSFQDGNFKLEKPEVILFDQDGVFVGVEYLIPIIGINDPAPEGFIGDMDEWHKTSTENFWELHVWVGIDNPNGMFATTNPNLP